MVVVVPKVKYVKMVGQVAEWVLSVLTYNLTSVCDQLGQWGTLE